MVVKKIDGISSANRNLESNVEMIRGVAGTPVVLEILDPISGTTSNFTVTRAIVDTNW